MLRQQRVQVQKFKSMLLVNALTTHLGVPRILGIHFRFSYSIGISIGWFGLMFTLKVQKPKEAISMSILVLNSYSIILHGLDCYAANCIDKRVVLE
jgi:hypothetical protein